MPVRGPPRWRPWPSPHGRAVGRAPIRQSPTGVPLFGLLPPVVVRAMAETCFLFDVLFGEVTGRFKLYTFVGERWFQKSPSNSEDWRVPV